MPPILALLLWFVLLVALLWFDPAKDKRTSAALWIPLTWMFFLGTRLPSQWIGSQGSINAQALEEGNPLDRTVFFALILISIAILLARSFNWGAFIAKNLFLIAFLTFAMLSVAWSDFPLVAAKRWVRDLGSYLVILVVLSDPRPVEAVRTVMRRLCYLLIPLCVLMIKYFPEAAKSYDPWSGVAQYVGATTSKNMLGVACLLGGIYFVWDTASRWSTRKDKRAKRVLFVNFAFIAMLLWLLALSNSATSKVCLVLGAMVVLVAHSAWGKRHSTLVKVALPSAFCLYLILAFGFDLNGQFASKVGRDPTLTDRTLIWNAVLSQHTNPLLGTGYETFWLGPRLDRVWAIAGHVNEAHNGYLEVYLNLGYIGLGLLVGMLLTGYRKIKNTATSSPTLSLAPFNLAVWSVMLFYNITEAAFRSGLMWMAILIATVEIAVPEITEIPATVPPTLRGFNGRNRFSGRSKAHDTARELKFLSRAKP
ncbi:MAG: O-antigen ligase family protein [Acidobacteria bacterium]|nr:O-antigen ligase family protein [Acidobacteriota bacterium]MBS1865025.1 O-antigen ligase family protein [Acidobacteriota bacterium]